EYAFDSKASAQDPQLSRGEHGLGGRGKRPEAVAQLGPQRLQLMWIVDPRQTTVDVELALVRWNEVVRQVVREIDGDVRGHELRRAIALDEMPHRFVEHSQVHIEADGMYEARLLRSQQIAGAAELQVLQRDPI